MPVSYHFWNFGSQPASDMSLCQCYHTSDTDGVLTFFECLCTIFLCLSSHRIATVGLVSVTLTREPAAIFTLAAQYWRLCGRNVYRETGAECCVQLEQCYCAEFWLDSTLLVYESVPSFGLWPDSQLHAYSTVRLSSARRRLFNYAEMRWLRKFYMHDGMAIEVTSSS